MNAVVLAGSMALAQYHARMSTTQSTPTPPASRVSAPRARNSYQAGETGTRRTWTWRAPTATPNSGVLANLSTLRARSRNAVRNDGIAKGAIDKLVTNIIGTGMTLRSKADDVAFQKKTNALFEQWTDYSDATGQLDFYGQQTQATRSWLEGGDVFARLRNRLPTDGLPVPFQVELLEAEFCPHDYNDYGRKIRAGIEFDAIGRRVAYWFYRSRPQLDDIDTSQLVRVPADQVIHLYDPLRPGQLRGVPVLTQALVKLYEIDKFSDAALLRQQIANLFAGFVRKPASVSDPQINPLTGAEASTDLAGKPFVEMNPGSMQELDPGDEIEFSDPPDAGNNFEAFMRQQLRAACTAIGVPYEVVTSDMSGLNDRIMRVLLNEFRRRVMAIQHQIVGWQFCRRVWNAFMDRAFLSGALPIPASYASNPDPWRRVAYAPHGWPYLHPVQDVEATEKAIRIGLTSRKAAVAEQGEDVEDVDAEQVEDNERADEGGLQYDCDGRHPANATNSAASARQPEPDTTAGSKAA